MQKISKVAGFQPADLFKHNSFTCTIWESMSYDDSAATLSLNDNLITYGVNFKQILVNLTTEFFD